MNFMTSLTAYRFLLFFNLLSSLLLAGCLGGGSGTSDSTLATTPKAAKLVLLVSNNNQPADGKSEVTLTVVARDANNTVIANVPVNIVSSSSTALFTAMNGTTDAQGTFQTTVKSQIKETFTVYVQSENLRSEQISLSFGEQSNAAKLVLLVSNNNQPADGKSEVTLTVVARDANNTVIANVPVNIVSSSSTALFTAMNGTTNALGTFQTTVKSQIKETFTVYAQSGNLRSEQVSLSFGEQTTDSRIKAINVVVENDGQSADGTTAITLIVVPRDKDNQPVTGIIVNLFSPSDAVLFDKISGNTDERGRFTVTATSRTPGTYQVIVRAGGTEAAPVNITFLPHLARANVIELNSSETILSANEAASITAIFKDNSTTVDLVTSTSYATTTLLANEGFNVTVSGNAKLHNVPKTSDNNGAATFTVTDDKAENVVLTVTSALATKTITLYFGASLELLPKVTNTLRQAKLTALLKDGQLSSIPNQKVKFGFTEKNNEILSANEVLTNAQGVAEITVTDLENDGGIAKLTASRGKLVSEPATVYFKAAFGKDRQLTATVHSNVLETTGKTTITATITNSEGTSIQGQTVKFRSNSNATQFSNVSSDSDAQGQVQTTVSNNLAEDIIVTVEADTAKQTIPLYFGAKVRLTPLNIADGVADGSTAVNLTASIENFKGQGIAGIPLNFRLNPGQGLLSKYFGNSDENGRVTFEIVDNVDETVTVAAQAGSLQVATAQVKFTAPAAPAAQIGSITLNSSKTELKLNDQIDVIAQVLDTTGKPAQLGTLVNFETSGIGTITPKVLTDSNGRASAIFQSTTQAGIATIKATAGNMQADLTLIVNPNNAGIIEVKKIDPQAIGIIGSGVVQSSTITFLIKDDLGNPVQDGTTVNFSLGTTTLGGGETISAASNITHNGLVSVALKSGSVAGNVDVIATVASQNGVQIRTSARVTIVGSVPDARHLSLAAEFLNIAGGVQFGLQDKITAYVGDRFGNIVPDGTGVSFITEGGTIGKSIGGGAFTTTTEFGQATAVLQSAEPMTPYLTGCSVPYPASLKVNGCGNPGLTTVVAYTTGSESFIDSNGNGQYDKDEPFDDLSEPYLDANDNFQFDTGELYVDVDKNGQFDANNRQFDANTTIWTSMKILFSGRTEPPDVTPKTFHLADGQRETFTVVLKDLYGNAMSAGTTFKVTTDVDTKVFDKDGKQIDTITPLGGILSGKVEDGFSSQFTFTLSNRGVTTTQAINIVISVTSPIATKSPGGNGSVDYVVSGSFGN
jgi:adhesin/invasin